MSTELIKLKATRPMWLAGRVVQAGETFKVDVLVAQDCLNSGRAELLNDIERATFTVAAAKQRELLAHRLARP